MPFGTRITFDRNPSFQGKFALRVWQGSKLLFGVALLLSILCNNCIAQPASSPGVSLEESLSEEVNDPTASLTQAQIQEFLTLSE